MKLPSYGYTAILCALMHYIRRMEKKRLVNSPEVFEDIMYAGEWRQKILELVSMLYSGLYCDISLQLELTGRIKRILYEVSSRNGKLIWILNCAFFSGFG